MENFICFKYDDQTNFWGAYSGPKTATKENPAPVALFLHGFGENASGPCRLFGNISNMLKNDLGVASLRISFRGFGESQGELVDRVIEDHLQDAYQALNWILEQDYLCHENIILVGHGYGGAIAATIAQHYPQIKKLILLSPPENLPKFFIERAYYSIYRPKSGARVFVNSEDVLSVLETKGCVDIYGYQYSHHFFESLQNYKPLVDIQNLASDTKVLILYGTNDKIVGEAPSLLIRTAVGHSSANQDRYCGLPIVGAGHYFNSVEDQKLVLEGIADYIRNN